jgi:hypothetical protein
MSCARNSATGFAVEILANPDGKLIPASTFDLPVYDTLVESSTTVSTNGGTLSFFQGGPSGTKVAELTITVADGVRTTQRTV